MHVKNVFNSNACLTKDSIVSTFQILNLQYFILFGMLNMILTNFRVFIGNPAIIKFCHGIGNSRDQSNSCR